MLFLITAASAIVPSLLLIWYFWARDVQREPGRVLWATFGFGVLSIFPVLLVALPLDLLAIRHVGPPLLHGALEALFTAAAPEEAAKLAVLLLYCDRHPEFDEPMDGIVYGAVASIGFATLENVLYVSGGGLGLALLRALTAVPGHAFLGAILGYHVGKAKFWPARRRRLILTGYLFAVACHALYDFPILSIKHLEKANGGKVPSPLGALVVLSVATLIFEWAWVTSRVRRLRIDQLHVVAVRAVQAGREPPPGILTAAPPSLGTRIFAWISLVFGALLASGGGLVTLVTILVAIFDPKDAPSHRGELAIGGGIGGALPLALGLLLFARGISRLRTAGPLSPYVARPAP